MTSQTTRRSFRVAIVTLALALASTAGSVSADVRAPAVNSGGSGGGQSVGMYDDVLAGSGYEVSAVAQADAPAAAASGDESLSAATASYEDIQARTSSDAVADADDVLAGSGYEQRDAAVADHPTQNERSIQMIESLNADDGRLAGGEDEDAAADSSQAPQAHSPQVAAY